MVVEPAAVVKLLNDKSVPEFESEAPLFRVTVPVGENVLEEFTVNAPATEKFAEGWAVGVAATVKPEKLRVPGEAPIVNPTAERVIVSPLAVNVDVEGTVRAPEILKFEEVVTVEEAARVKPWKVGALPEVTIEAPLFKVIVPPLGANAAEVVRAPPTVAVVEAVIAALIVKLL